MFNQFFSPVQEVGKVDNIGTKELQQKISSSKRLPQEGFPAMSVLSVSLTIESLIEPLILDLDEWYSSGLTNQRLLNQNLTEVKSANFLCF